MFGSRFAVTAVFRHRPLLGQKRLRQIANSAEPNQVVYFLEGGREFGPLYTPSFALIFFRSAIDIGLPVLICDTSGINSGDDLEFDLEAGTGRNRSTGTVIGAAPLPRVMINILRDGGLATHIRKHKTFQMA